MKRESAFRLNTILLVILGIAALALLVQAYRDTQHDMVTHYAADQATYARQISNSFQVFFGVLRNGLLNIAHGMSEAGVSEESIDSFYSSYIGSIDAVVVSDSSGGARIAAPDSALPVVSAALQSPQLRQVMSSRYGDFRRVDVPGGRDMIAYFVPAFGEDGGFRGKVGVLLESSRFFYRFFLFPADRDWPVRVWVMDGDGTVLFSDDGGDIGRHYGEAFAAHPGFVSLLDSLDNGGSFSRMVRVPSEGAASKALVQGFHMHIENASWLLVLSASEEVVLAGLVPIRNRWLTGSIVAILVGGIYMVLLVGSWHRLNEARRHNRLLGHSRRLSAAWESTDEGILMTDADGGIIYHNRAAGRIAGVEGPLRGRKVCEAMPRGLRQGFDTLLDESGASRSMEVEDRSGRTIEVRSSCFRDPDRSEPTYIFFMHDSTERKRMERELLEAQKMEAVGMLAGGIAHDFNNLLVGIQGHSSILKKNPEDSESVRRAASIIDRASIRAAKLVDQLMRFARPGDESTTVVNLSDMVRYVVKLIERTFDRSIEIATELADVHVDGDPSQLEQVILNLAVNSRDAMPDGGELRIEAGPCRDSKIGDCACLRVSDTGSGIPEEYRERVFEPFFTTKEKGKGTGMGLSTVYSIVRAHDGRIDLESELGDGTSITVRLPSVEDGGSCHSKPAPKDLAEGEGGRLLLVDDDDIVLQTAAEMLSELGFDVVSAESGPEAIRLFSQDPDSFVLVVLDLSMPGMDGSELFEKLLKIRKDLRALLSTGYEMDSRVERMRRAGLCGVVGKPYTFFELSEGIRSALSDGGIPVSR